jgi:hypothetical protein
MEKFRQVKYISPVSDRRLRMIMNNKLLLTLFILVGLITKLEAQTPNFCPMDENFELIQKFYNTDTVIVIFPDSESMSFRDKQDVENFIFWGKKPAFIFKRESVLVPADFDKHLQLYGAIFNFKNSYSKIPITVCKNSFCYKNESFHNDNDAFYFLTDNSRILYTCRNTNNALNPFSIYGIGAYQLYIYSDYEIRYSGYSDPVSHEGNINDIRELKNQYFLEQSTLYFTLNIAKTLNIDSIYNVLSDSLDKYVINLCNYLKVDTSNIDKMKLFIYANRIDLQKFIAAPFWSTVYGKCMGNVLHAYGVNLATIKHETAHSIIFQKIGYYSNPFFDEGFRQYTEYFFNKNAYSSDLETTKNHLEFLNKELLKGDNNFFNNQENYSISGVFTKYIIGKIGLSEFKTAFSQQSIEEYLIKNYNISTEKLLEEFKNSL